jgi:hypothetical protein
MENGLVGGIDIRRNLNDLCNPLILWRKRWRVFCRRISRRVLGLDDHQLILVVKTVSVPLSVT